MVISWFWFWFMRHIQVVEAKAQFSALLAAVESGESVAITRRGNVVARIIPDKPRMASDVFEPLWCSGESDEIDFVAPEDTPPDPVTTL